VSVGLPVRFHVPTPEVAASREAAADVLSAARAYAVALDEAQAGSVLDDVRAARLDAAQGALLDAAITYAGAAQVAALQSLDNTRRTREAFGVRL